MARTKSDFKPGRLGMAFKNGKFYDFSRRHVMVMAPWPNPRAWLKRASHGWKQTRKFPDEWLRYALFLKGSVCQLPEREPYLGPIPEWVEIQARRDHDLLAAFFDLIPDSVRAEVLRYERRRWHLLNLMARCPGAEDLCRSNPGLAYALASNWVFHKPAVTRPMRAARSLVNRKQKIILEWLRFPATETARRILAKIVPKSLSVEALLYLRTALTDPWVTRTLSHLERINASALRLAADPQLRAHVTPRLIAELSHDPEEDQQNAPMIKLFWDTLRMARVFDWCLCPREFVSLHRLQTAHDELTERLAEREGYAMPARFPPPPFVGTETIQPVRTPGELVQEGREMHHCVAVRAGAIAAGYRYIYRVLAPVRATLAIGRRGASWDCDEIRGVCNKAVPPEIQRAVMQQLLRAAGPGVPNRQPWFPAWEDWLHEEEPRKQVPDEAPEVVHRPRFEPISWDAEANAARIEALPPIDRQIYERCLAVFGNSA